MTTRETTVSCPACGGTRVQAIEEWRRPGEVLEHDLDGEFTNGRPVRMRLLARKAAAPVTPPDPAPALRAAIETVGHAFTRRGGERRPEVAG